MAAVTTTSPAPRARQKLNWTQLWTIARTDLRQLAQARDFWVPMAALGSIFFFIVPTILLLVITRVSNVDVVEQLSTAIKVLPQAAQSQIKGETGQAKAAYAMAVYLFAPVAVVVPLTISTAVGAAKSMAANSTCAFMIHSI